MSLDWNELRKKIAEKQDIALFDEAVKCYQGGAFRMAYIAIWICVAESLRNKILVMSQKDSVADEIIKEIEELEARHAPTDRLILNKSKELGILDDSSYLQIEHILTMRNIYAHPYNIGPIPKEVELAFIHAIEKVLSVPPLLRKPYIEYLLKNLQNNRHFIDDVEEKVIKFAQDITNKISPSLYPYTLKGLFYRLNEVINDPDKKIFRNRIIWFARAFIDQIKPNFNEAQWGLRDKFNDFPKAITQIFSENSFWDMAPGDVQDGILGCLLYPEEEVDGKKLVLTAPDENVKQAFLLYKNDKLTDRQKERFLNWIEAQKLYNLARWGIPLEYYIDRVIQALSSHNWYTQNPAASCLWDLGPDAMKNISSERLVQLGRNILQAADGLSRDAISFIKKTIDNEVKWPKSFIKGILLESFVNENLEFRCKYNYLYEALLITIRFSLEDSSDLFKDLLQKINTSTPKFGKDFYHGEKEAIERIDSLLPELSDKELEIYKEILLELRANLEARLKKTH